MSFRGAFWLVFWMAVAWAVFLVVRHGALPLAAVAPQWMVPAELVVAESSCSRSGDEVLWSCEAEGRVAAAGAVDGTPATLRWQESDGHYLQPETRVPVHALAPPGAELVSLPATLVVPAASDPRSVALARLAPDLRRVGFGAAAIVLAFVLHLAGRLLRSRDPDRIELEHHGSSPGCAAFLIGLAVPLLALGLDSALLGGVALWGLGLLAFAFLAELRRFVVVDRRAGTLRRGWQLFVLRRQGPPRRLGEIEGLVRGAARGAGGGAQAGGVGDVALAIRTADGDEEVMRSLEPERVAQAAARLGDFLRRPVLEGAPAAPPPGEATPGEESPDDAAPGDAASWPEPADEMPAMPIGARASARLADDGGVARGILRLVGCLAVVGALVVGALAFGVADDGAIAAWWRDLTGAGEAPPPAGETP